MADDTNKKNRAGDDDLKIDDVKHVDIKRSKHWDSRIVLKTALELRVEYLESRISVLEDQVGEIICNQRD